MARRWGGAALVTAVSCTCTLASGPATLGCHTPPAVEEPAMRTPSPPWTVMWSDGSANLFTFTHPAADTPVTVTYDPVTPEHSSSGMYSGGSPRTSRVDEAATAELWSHVEQMEVASAAHPSPREKGTGQITLTVSGAPRHFVVGRGPWLEAFDAFVAPYRGAAAQAIVTLVGVAQNAKVGALIVTDVGPRWVDLEAWPDAVAGHTVQAVGRWTSRPDLPVHVVQPGAPAQAGIPVPPGTDLAEASQREVLALVEWALLPEPAP